jgi:uncharacterized protein YjbI with pentapeptide repeats
MDESKRRRERLKYAASEEGIKRIEDARRRKGWDVVSLPWADKANVSVSSVKRFQYGTPITREVFEACAMAVGITDIESLVKGDKNETNNDCDKSQDDTPNELLGTTLTEELEPSSSASEDPKEVLKMSEEIKPKKRVLIITLEGNINELGIPDLLSHIKTLEMATKTTLEFRDVYEGSIKVLLVCTEEDANKILAAFRNGSINNLIDIKIIDINLPNKLELTAFIQNNMSEGINLSEVDLSSIDLRNSCIDEIILDNADLTGSSLVGVKLRNASLNNANLSHADLSNADLSDSFLSGANLTSANLSYSVCDRVDLEKTLFNNTLVVGAKFGDNTNTSYEMEMYLRENGAILDSLTPSFSLLRILDKYRPDHPYEPSFLISSSEMASLRAGQTSEDEQRQAKEVEALVGRLYEIFNGDVDRIVAAVKGSIVWQKIKQTQGEE